MLCLRSKKITWTYGRDIVDVEFIGIRKLIHTLMGKRKEKS